MVPRNRATADDSSSEDINMDKMVETKDELNKIRRDRQATRTQLQRDLDKTLADLGQRIKQTVDAHTQQRGATHKAQIDRLQQAVATRDGIAHQIKEKMGELQLETKRLVAVLERGYAYRLEKASSSLVTPVSEQKAKVKPGVVSS